MFDEETRFRAEIEAHIARNAHSSAFRLGPEEIRILGYGTGKLVKIGLS